MSKVKMPKPKPILTLSWEDIHTKAEELGHRLSRSQIIDIFDSIEQGDSDVIQDGFWLLIEERIDGIKNSTDNEDES